MFLFASIVAVGLLACHVSTFPLRESSASFAYDTGLQLGWISGPLLLNYSPRDGEADRESDVVGGAKGPVESNCVDVISLELEEELEQMAASTGFRLSDQMLAPLSDQSHLESICKVFEQKSRSLEECQVGSNQVQRERRDTAVFTIMKLICVKYTRVLERSSTCMSDAEKTSHWECVDACRGPRSQSSPAAVDTATTNHSTSIPPSDGDGDGDIACKQASCAIQCIAELLYECEDDGQNKLNDLYSFYNEIAGAQILYGVEVAQRQIGGNAYSLLDSKKIPATCQQLIERSVENASTELLNKKLMHNTEGDSSSSIDAPMIDEV